MEKFNEKEKDMLKIGIGLYKVQIKKILKGSESLRVGYKEVKQKFLEAEALLGKLTK